VPLGNPKLSAARKSCIPAGARGRFYNVVDLFGRLEIETRNGRQGWFAERTMTSVCAVLA
jgi:hypothetical protein